MTPLVDAAIRTRESCSGRKRGGIVTNVMCVMAHDECFIYLSLDTNPRSIARSLSNQTHYAPRKGGWGVEGLGLFRPSDAGLALV